MNGKTARLFLPTPAYYHSHLPALLVTAPRPAWHENPTLTVRRLLKQMVIDDVLCVNGREIRRRNKTRGSEPYVIDGRSYSLTEAVAYVCGDSGEA